MREREQVREKKENETEEEGKWNRVKGIIGQKETQKGKDGRRDRERQTK